MKLLGTEVSHILNTESIGEPPQTVTCTIDTRTLVAGETYVALRGERFDGHCFLAQAQERGAVASIVDHVAALGADCSGWVVADTHAAYFSLATAMRAHFCGAVLAITGSVGKTTTKEFLVQILRQVIDHPIVASPANENNEIGVAKLLHRLGSEAVAVVEMGARHFGDIAPLVAMARPNVSILTNIGQAHLEIFGSPERLAATKWQIFSPNSQPIINLGDETSRILLPTLAKAPIYAGLQSDVQQALPEPYVFAVIFAENALLLLRPGKAPARVPLLSHLPGEHNRRNLVAACAGALALGMPLDKVGRAAQNVRLPAGRYERRQSSSGAMLIDDSYNASPSGVLATLAAFAGEVAKRRFVVCSSMAELGEYASQEHRRVGAAIAALAPEGAFMGGEHAGDLLEGAREAGLPATRMAYFSSNAELIGRLREVLRCGDTVLVKGSRKYRLEEVVEALSTPMSGQ